MNNRIYSYLWNKYRPAIVQLMLESEKGPQQYNFFDHEFKGLDPKERNYSFELHAYQGKATNNIRTSNTAQDLLAILVTSRKAVELMDTDHFEFVMDKKFVLHVKRVVSSIESHTPEEVVPADQA
jgi:hypothetical protein